MGRMGRLIRRVRYLINRARHEDDLADELRFHQDMKEQQLRADGVPSTDVASSARRAIGNDLAARQYSRDVWIWPWLQDIAQDVRFGIRMLLKDRRFTAAAVVALALGIAVNNSVFTIVNAALLRDLPFEEAHRLVRIRAVDARGFQLGLSFQELQEWRAAATSFEGLAGDTSTTMNVTDASHAAERLRGTYISANAFRLLRVQPILGREFRSEDELPGAPPTAILSYDGWQGRYGGDPAIVGQSIRVNDVPAIVIGVMPSGMNFPLTAQMWQPLSLLPTLPKSPRTARTVNVVGRLRDGVDLERARADIATLAARAAQQMPDAYKDVKIDVVQLKQVYIGDARGFLGTLMGAVSF